jgi:hypothetical protein
MCDSQSCPSNYLKCVEKNLYIYMANELSFYLFTLDPGPTCVYENLGHEVIHYKSGLFKTIRKISATFRFGFFGQKSI